MSYHVGIFVGMIVVAIGLLIVVAVVNKVLEWFHIPITFRLPEQR